MTDEEKKVFAEKMVKARAEKKEKVESFVTKEEFNTLSSKMDTILGAIQKTPEVKASETMVNKEIDQANQNFNPINPLWEADAKEVLGDALDHCEVFYPKEGGTLYTVIIKTDIENLLKKLPVRKELHYSNTDYSTLIMAKSDRRTKDVAKEGFEGVKKWNRLIKQNLNRKQ